MWQGCQHLQLIPPETSPILFIEVKTEHGTIGHAWFIDILLSLMDLKLYSHRSPLIHTCIQKVVNLLYMPFNHDLYAYIT